MNAWLNAAPSAVNETAMPTTQYRLYKKDSSLSPPGAANLWLFVDENPFSVNDGFFLDIPTDTGWVDCPASYHNGACGINFCDGHAQIRKWTDPTVLTWTYQNNITARGSNKTADFEWFVKERTTASLK